MQNITKHLLNENCNKNSAVIFIEYFYVSCMFFNYIKIDFFCLLNSYARYANFNNVDIINYEQYSPESIFFK